ncbi:MAG TPA: nitrilase-related carbon-nitrogen hydrolase, partial [Spirochaetia bacterium]|nr:nitrilase-related carbon-nitrogen hydrolase [Spirochaetia bacterium]
FIKKGADLWINITNVSWSRQESAEIQMLVAARFRSIENHRYFLRATNGGVTSVIDSMGRILHQLELFAPQVLFADLPIEREQAFTPYTVFGDYFPWLLALMLLVMLVFQNRIRWRRHAFQFSIRKRF